MVAHVNTHVGGWMHDYAENGWPVFPVHTAAKRPHPLVARDRDQAGEPIAGTGGFKKATQSPDTIDEWLAADQPMNVGIAVGEVAGFDVLDIDGPKGEESLKRLLKDIGLDSLPQTLTASTPSGSGHVCFKHTPGLKNWAPAVKGGAYPGIDVRTTGGYVVAEPSKREEGCYEWSSSPFEVEIAAWPPSLLEKIKASHAAVPKGKPVERPSVDQGVVMRRAKSYVLKCDEAIEGEDGHNRTLAAASKIVRTFPIRSVDQLIEVLDVFNEKRCTPPWSDSELQHKAEDAWKLNDYEGGYREGGSRLATPQGAPRIQAPRPNLELPADGEALPGYFGRNDRGNGLRLARALEGLVHYAGPAMGWLQWTGAHWSKGEHAAAQIREVSAKVLPFVTGLALESLPTDEMSEKEQREEEKRRAGYVSSCGNRNDRLRALADAGDHPSILIDPDHFDENPYLLTVLNGTIDLRDKSIRPHAPRDLITHLVDVPFDPDARAPRWEKYLREVTGDQQDMIDLLQRAAGWTLTGEGCRHAKRFFYLYGPGNSGKGTFLAMLAACLGKTLSGPISWGALSSKTTGGPNSELAQLEGKRMAMIPDSGANPSWDGEVLKVATGGLDPLTCSEKNKPARTYLPRFSLWIAANDRPRVYGTGGKGGVFNRLTVLPFKQAFSDDPEKLASGEAMPKDDKLGDYLLEHEMPGILAWAVEGTRLYLDGGLGTCKAANAEGKDWIEGEKDWLESFCDEHLWAQTDKDAPLDVAKEKVTAKDLWLAVRGWMKQEQAPAKQIERVTASDRKTSRDMNVLIATNTRFAYVEKNQVAQRLDGMGSRARAWGGLQWKNEAEALAFIRLGSASADTWHDSY